MTFTGPAIGPCEPFTTWDEIAACGQAPTLETPAQDLVVDVASETIWGLLGERFTGACERVVLPCWQGGCGWSPAFYGSYDYAAYSGPSGCCCEPVHRLDLGALPVWGVSSIVIDGLEVDNTDGLAYRLEDWRWLIWLSGPEWPRCAGNWEITYTFGVPIPARARRAASLLGLEMAKQCAAQPCGLDAQTTSYSREGVTVQLSASSDMIAKGGTGIPTIDLLLQSLGGRGGGGSLLDLSAAGRSRHVSWTLLDGDS